MIEYKVRPVIRYIVTRYEAPEPTWENGEIVAKGSITSSVIGEFENEQTAEDVKTAFSGHALIGNLT